VTGYEIRKGGWFSFDFSVFLIETELQGKKEKLKVHRKDTEFYQLRRLMKMEFPHLLIPPLPGTHKKQLKLVEK
jgi:hypothetical protein